MPYRITTRHSFSAAHQLRLYDGSLEPIHGHNWRIAVTVRAEQLDAIGVVMDFHELERVVNAILAPFHNRLLNDVAPFDGELNPSAENVAYHIARSLNLPQGVQLTSVEAWETDNCSAIYEP